MDVNIDQEIADMFSEVEEAPVEATETTTDVEETPVTAEATTENTEATSETEGTETKSSEIIKNTDVNSTTQSSSKTNDTESETQTEPFSAEAKFSKQNRAFAEMRIQNKGYESFIMNMAKAANLDVRDAAEAKALLESRLNDVVAKQKKMDPEVLAELEENRRTIAAMKAEQTKQNAIAGFSKLKTLHGLSDSDLTEFADKLIAENKNPFEQEMDLVKEYRLAYFDKLIEKAREEGAAAEIARSQKAAQSSSSPTTKRSSDPTGESNKVINSPKDLDEMFKSLGLD